MSIVRTCPVQLSFDAMPYAREYTYWRKGMMPVEGTYRNQSHKFLQVMAELDHWIEQRKSQNE